MRPLVWFRADLRVSDNPALHEACRRATRGVAAVFVICPDQWKQHDWADVKVDFIVRHLEELSGVLGRINIPLLIEVADTFDDVPELLVRLALRHECDAVYYNDEYEVNERRRDQRVTEAFAKAGLGAQSFTDQVVIAPGAVRTKDGGFYSVFTPFKRSWIARVEEQGVPKPLAVPKKLTESVTKSSAVPDSVAGFSCDEEMAERWPAGETVARKKLTTFLRHYIRDYEDARNFPGRDGTSGLSAHLAVGSISIRECLYGAWQSNDESLDGKSGQAVWISELVWREFYRHVLIGYPRVCMNRAFRVETDNLPWRYDEEDFQRWCDGETGYPIVDAAMRQLNETGWMHNRLRMIAAMFLTKDLFIDWRWGEQYFMQHLIDGDLASNNGGWQWSASTGTDAAPYFRIFNPFSQSKKFDPDGGFIRGAHVPELGEVEAPAIHEPHTKSGSLFDDLDYPEPMVDHSKARDRVIAAFKGLAG